LAAGGDFDKCIENIDIGGPAMIRAAAKNHGDVAVIVDNQDFTAVLEALDKHEGKLPGSLRKSLAQKAYARTAAYDAAISNWFADQLDISTEPDYRSLGGRLKQSLRYGENPHQNAGFYVGGPERFGVATADQIQGKELSFNNINDTNAAFELVAEMDADMPACAIIKHANPCGVATAATMSDAFSHALKCDPVSAFGGIIALNKPLDAETAAAATKIFTEVIIAPYADEDARAIIGEKKNLRLLLTGGMPDPAEAGLDVRTVSGGLLVQNRDNGRISREMLQVVTKRQPDDRELEDMLFAFRVAKHVKSNAIIYAKNGATVGIGAGQMSRIDSARIAASKSEDAAKAAEETETLTKGSVVASDAFFPFADGLISAAQAGVTAVIQPGGSIRDDEVIAAADEAGLAMVVTGMRHFKH
ncbi:MAG: bifunctional phosphoribosylaminoimidazolecarboxamide formyltransferase/IMP cyclohydrolase PurH, partial [PS1 clade bacterium]